MNLGSDVVITITGIVLVFAILGDVVAAIMAAIHAMGNGKYTLKAVRRAANGWSKAGVNDTTAPF